ncbi:MAG: glutathione S-transferase [Brevundimonas sp.]|uniref:glutathione S-transferase n=1 Tax=Brevundimonas sp. TaxID=1871086 RepID=UPI00121AF566|nr:glutathione S-transferase [Brevundimonas sp.]RZJ18664.1 MAG: glutathione S-transferase [Brevundimonas sp.]
MELLIGPQIYSTWSLRGWLVMKATGAAFTVRHGRYDTEADRAELRALSPSGFVPLLRVDGEMIWDTLAIAEWAAEHYPQARLWPADPVARAQARSVTAEMHSGFTALRTFCTMGGRHMMVGDTRSETPSDPALDRDLGRIVALLRQMRARFGGAGPFLFGEWSIADAFYTPVAARVRHYQIALDAHGDSDGVARAYLDTLLAHPDFREWERQALAGTR